MSYYAVWYITNSEHPNNGKVGGFIVEGEDEDLPLCRETEKEIEDLLKEHPMFKAGLVDIIEI